MRNYQPYFTASGTVPAPNGINIHERLVGPFATDAVFVSLDHEAVCRTKSDPFFRLTELGVSILDTRWLSGTVPGDRGCQLFLHIDDTHLVLPENFSEGHGLPGKCPCHYHKGDIYSPLFCESEDVTLWDIRHKVLGLLHASGKCHYPCQNGGTGSSAQLEMHQSINKQNALNKAHRQFFFIFHDPRGDLQALRDIGINLERDFPGCKIIDTQQSTLNRNISKPQPKLVDLLRATGVTHDQLHNGSNDAHFTLEAFIAMVFMTPKQEMQFGKTDLGQLGATWDLLG